MEIVELNVILIKVSQQFGFAVISPPGEERRDLVDCFPKRIESGPREWVRDCGVAGRASSDKKHVKPASDNVLRS